VIGGLVVVVSISVVISPMLTEVTLGKISPGIVRMTELDDEINVGVGVVIGGSVGRSVVVGGSVGRSVGVLIVGSGVLIVGSMLVVLAEGSRMGGRLIEDSLMLIVGNGGSIETEIPRGSLDVDVSVVEGSVAGTPVGTSVGTSVGVVVVVVVVVVGSGEVDGIELPIVIPRSPFVEVVDVDVDVSEVLVVLAPVSVLVSVAGVVSVLVDDVVPARVGLVLKELDELDSVVVSVEAVVSLEVELDELNVVVVSVEVVVSLELVGVLAGVVGTVITVGGPVESNNSQK
jgi:hypothetical protein